jgi:hypothetical protein
MIRRNPSKVSKKQGRARSHVVKNGDTSGETLPSVYTKSTSWKQIESNKNKALSVVLGRLDSNYKYALLDHDPIEEVWFEPRLNYSISEVLMTLLFNYYLTYESKLEVSNHCGPSNHQKDFSTGTRSV